MSAAPSSFLEVLTIDVPFYTSHRTQPKLYLLPLTR
jgi:hypothetical protein